MTRVVNFWDRSSKAEQEAFNFEVVSSSLTGPTSYHIKTHCSKARWTLGYKPPVSVFQYGITIDAGIDSYGS